MIKSQLVHHIAEKNNMKFVNAERVVNIFLDTIKDALLNRDRVELRGFGVLSIHERPERTARNPRTGSSVQVTMKEVPFFKAGKILKETLNSKDTKKGA